jgi:hypothetical protein
MNGLYLFLLVVATVAAVGVVVALRMSYEKFCIRTGKPFRSWIKD